MKFTLESSILSVALATLAACAPISNEPNPNGIQKLSQADFACAVEPILIKDCSYMACHGQDGAALRVYSMGKLRLGDTSTLRARQAKITADERTLNFQSAEAFTYGGVAPDDNLILRKPMPSTTGGFEHIGGAVWSGPDDPRVVTIRNWLSGVPVTCAH